MTVNTINYVVALFSVIFEIWLSNFGRLGKVGPFVGLLYKYMLKKSPKESVGIGKELETPFIVDLINLDENQLHVVGTRNLSSVLRVVKYQRFQAFIHNFQWS